VSLLSEEDGPVHTLGRARAIAVIAVAIAFSLGTAVPAMAAGGHARAAVHHHHAHASKPRTKPKPKPTAATTAPATAQAPAATQMATGVILTCADQSLLPTPADVGRIAAATLCLVNQLRVAAGVAPLVSNAALTAAAADQSAGAVAGDQASQVSRSDGLLDRLEGVGYVQPGAAFGAAENWSGADTPVTPAATVGVWQSNPELLANILDPTFRDTGISVVAAAPAVLGGASGGVTYTEDFGAGT
jgi:uncharacterized protein YkwD